MREILFRGKRTDNGEWEYGDLWCNSYGKRVVCIVSPINDQGTTGGNEVNPETVCQFTGLYNKNGRKIFEGDIVKWTGSLYKVVFEQRFGIAYFGIKISDYETWYFCNSCAANLMEIAGNVYDNPELLKGGNDNG